MLNQQQRVDIYYCGSFVSVAGAHDEYISVEKEEREKKPRAEEYSLKLYTVVHSY